MKKSIVVAVLTSLFIAGVVWSQGYTPPAVRAPGDAGQLIISCGNGKFCASQLYDVDGSFSASTPPGSPANSVQFNNAGAFTGNSNMTFAPDAGGAYSGPSLTVLGNIVGYDIYATKTLNVMNDGGFNINGQTLSQYIGASNAATANFALDAGYAASSGYASSSNSANYATSSQYLNGSVISCLGLDGGGGDANCGTSGQVATSAGPGMAAYWGTITIPSYPIAAPDAGGIVLPNGDGGMVYSGAGTWINLPVSTTESLKKVMYVDIGGADSVLCGTLLSPCRSFAQTITNIENFASTASYSWEVVALSPGTYDAAGTGDISITNAVNITIKGTTGYSPRAIGNSTASYYLPTIVDLRGTAAIGGLVAPITQVATTNTNGIAVTPNGQYLYKMEYDPTYNATIKTYSINSSDGSLTLYNTLGAYSINSIYNLERLFFATKGDGSKYLIWAANPLEINIIPVNSSYVPGVPKVNAVAGNNTYDFKFSVSSDGSCIVSLNKYNYNGQNEIRSFTYSSDGTVTPHTNEHVDFGGGSALAGTFSSDGRFYFIADSGAVVRVYSVSACVLTSAWTYPSESIDSPSDMVYNNGYLYLTNFDSKIWTWKVAADGSLSGKVLLNDATNFNHSKISVNRTGSNLFATSQAGKFLSVFSFDGTDGHPVSATKYTNASYGYIYTAEAITSVNGFLYMYTGNDPYSVNHTNGFGYFGDNLNESYRNINLSGSTKTLTLKNIQLNLYGSAGNGKIKLLTGAESSTVIIDNSYLPATASSSSLVLGATNVNGSVKIKDSYLNGVVSSLNQCRSENSYVAGYMDVTVLNYDEYSSVPVGVTPTLITHPVFASTITADGGTGTAGQYLKSAGASAVQWGFPGGAGIEMNVVDNVVCNTTTIDYYQSHMSLDGGSWTRTPDAGKISITSVCTP